MKPTAALLLGVLVLVATAQPTLAAFTESFTTNPEAQNKAAPFLWVTLGKVEAGGRGPVDPTNPTAGNEMVLGHDNPVAETTLMIWNKENVNATCARAQSCTPVEDSQLSFFLWLSYSCCCDNPIGLLKLSWSHDSMDWQPLWNRTIARMTVGQWEAIKVNITPQVRSAPAAFKWVFTSPASCWIDKYLVSMDDITFPTIAPSADIMHLGKAPPAPLPSPAVCAS
jgi:hypothetical protein